jgi:glycyl-tRNA synthetase beta chain
MENSLKLPLGKSITKALSLYPEFTDDNELINFIMERLKVFLRTEGVGHDRIASVFATNNEDDINRLVDKVRALDIFLSSEDGANLLIAYRRAANIVTIESKKNNVSFLSAPDKKLFRLGQEKDLSNRLAEIQALLPSLVQGEKFNAAMEVLATLRTTVDAYFENVTVNTDDVPIRENRLKTLNLIVRTMNTVANFSLIEN